MTDKRNREVHSANGTYENLTLKEAQNLQAKLDNKGEPNDIRTAKPKK